MNHGNRLFSGLPAESTVARAIQNALPAMSEAQRRFAALVQAEPLRVARLSINDAVSGADVSVATANRFATALGYAGYPEFRADLIRAFEDFFVPVERLKRRQAEKRSAMDIAQAAFAEDLESIGATASSLDSASLEAAVQQIIAARRVFVAGFDLSAHLGGMLAIGLVMTGCDAQTVPSGGGAVGAVRTLTRMGPQDLVITIAFPHYYRDTIDMAGFAKGADIPVLAITDSPRSPLVPLAQVALYVTAKQELNAPSPSSAAILSLIEALVATVASQRPEAAEASERFASSAYPWMTNR